MDLNRFEWLALRQEDAVDPDRTIVDPHHHLWDDRQWRGILGEYLAPELLEDLTGSHNVVKTVFVDCMSNYYTGGAEPLRPVGRPPSWPARPTLSTPRAVRPSPGSSATPT